MIQKPIKKPINKPEIQIQFKQSSSNTKQLKTFSFHSPLKNPPIDEFPLDLTLENFYHPTANSLRPV